VDSILKNGAWQRTKEMVDFSCLQGQSSAAMPLHITCNSVKTFRSYKEVLLLLYPALWRVSLIRVSGKSVADSLTLTHALARAHTRALKKTWVPLKH